MLRRSLVALMLGAICAGNAIADEAPTQKPASKGLISWFRGRSSGPQKPASDQTARTGKLSRKESRAESPAGGIERAVVSDAERQSVAVRRTSGGSDETRHDMTVPPVPQLQPVPIEQAPVLPNISSVSGPQYFSATPAGFSNPLPVTPSANWQTYQAPRPISMTSAGMYTPAPNQAGPAGPVYQSGAPMMMQGTGQYPQTGAALYPAPIPGIPQQIGGTAVINPAFHHHEMLYPHSYKAMYPPYYYKVNGGWMVTPFGVWSHEDWRLQGTTVDVKYKSHISPFTFFTPPTYR